MSKGTDILLAGIAGAAVGLTAGVLLAPQSGQETRNQIGGKAEDILKELEGLKKQTSEFLSKKNMEGWKDAAESKLKELLKELESLKDKAVDVIEKQTGKETKEEIYAKVDSLVKEIDKLKKEATK